MIMKYQAIILGGGKKSGNLLYPLCKNQSKCLLPVSNKPMIFYQLDILEKAGFGPQDILILLTKNHEEVAALLQKRAEVFYVSDDSESGTALLEAAEKIRRDFILMSCDIMVGVNLLDLLDFHYKGKAAITCLIKEEDLDKKLGKAPVSCNLDDSFEIMFIGSDQRILYIVNSEESDEISVGKNVLLACDQVNIMSNLFDTHVYVCQYEVLGLLQKLAEMNSDLQIFKEDFLPFLLKNQRNSELLNRVIQKEQGIFGKRSQQEFCIKAYITQGYVRRLNNIKDYQQANFEAMIKGPKGIPMYQSVQEQQTYSKDVKVSPDSVIGEGTKLGAKCTIQRSLIGKNCTIAENVKISNSIIMKNVVINQSCIIQNCILSDESAIGHGTELNKCLVGKLTQVEPNSKLVDEAVE